MSKRVLCDLEALKAKLIKDNAILLNTNDKVTKRTRIYFKCHCGEENNKLCQEILKRAGAFCKSCTTKNSLIKLHNTIENPNIPLKCNIDTFNEVIQRDNAILLEKYDVVTNNMTIKFKCNCGEEATKNCLQLVTVSGAFCKSCTRINWTRKIKETNIGKYGVDCTIHATHIKGGIIKNNINKYGVENVLQSKEIKEKIKKTNIEKYGVEIPSQCQEVKEKIKKKYLEKYGVDNPMKVNEIKEKVKATNLEKYGVEYIQQSEVFREKFKETCLERYGVEHISQTSEFREKVKQTFINNYGIDNPNKTKEVRDKIKKTNIKRYGVEYPSQNLEIQERTQKNAKKYKEYKLPSGTIIKVQGYEPFALDELVKVYQEDDIITARKEIPRITYQVQEKKRYYFPDIYIKSQNKIIEVKSTWTYKSKLDSIQEKAQATKDAGYDYEIWVYDAKGNKTLG